MSRRLLTSAEPIIPSEGYRLLTRKDKIQDTDEWWNTDSIGDDWDELQPGQKIYWKNKSWNKDLYPVMRREL